MKFILEPHRQADIVLSSQEYLHDWTELCDVLHSISEEDLINGFDSLKARSPSTKSLAAVINQLIRERLVRQQWKHEVRIFKDDSYNSQGAWRLDFASENLAVEVAFNHGEAIAHNMMKPVLASELNHVKKDVQTSVGILITVTQEMKIAGNFDSAVGTFEKHIMYLKPYFNLVSCPMMLIGLEAPKNFRIDPGTRSILSQL